MGMSVTISAATEQDAEQIFRLQYLCFQSEAELYGNYRIEPLIQTLDSVRAEVAADCVFVARLGDEVVGSVRGTRRRGRHRARSASSASTPASRATASAPGCCAPSRRPSPSSAAPSASACTPATAARATCGCTARCGYEPVGTRQGADGVPMVVLEKPAARTRPRPDQSAPGGLRACTTLGGSRTPQALPLRRSHSMPGDRQQHRDEQVAHAVVRPHGRVGERRRLDQRPGAHDQYAHQLGGAADQRRLAGRLPAAHQRVRDERRTPRAATADSE